MKIVEYKQYGFFFGPEHDVNKPILYVAPDISTAIEAYISEHLDEPFRVVILGRVYVCL